MVVYVFFVFKQKTAYEMRISDWSSDVCSSDLRAAMVSAVISCCDSAHRANSNANSSAVSMPLLCSPSLRYGERWRTAAMGRAPGWCWGLACSLRIDRAWPVRTRPDRAPAAWPTFARLAHVNLESLRRAGLRSHRPFAYIGPSLPLRLLGGDCSIPALLNLRPN